jgi:WD40-like Beta Propeller Repeat
MRLEVPPSFLPDARHFLFLIENHDEKIRGIYIGALDGMEPRRLLDAEAAALHPPSGQLLFIRQGTLFAQRLDSTGWQMVGSPYPIAEHVIRAGNGLSVSADGTIAYRVGTASGTPMRQFAWFNRLGRKLADVGEPIDGAGSPALSPDGHHVALYRRIPNWSVWLLDLERGAVSRFTIGAGDQVNPVWSPDGRRIVYLWRGTGASDLYEKSMDGSGDEKPLLVTDQDKTPSDWSPDSKFVLYRNTDPKTGSDLWALPLEVGRKPFPVVQTEFEEQDGQFSPPDGRWLAYESNKSGRVEIYVQPFLGPGSSTKVSLEGGSQIRWRKDGRELFYVAPDHRLMAVAVSSSGDGALKLGRPVALFSLGRDVNYMVAADGQRLLLNSPKGGESTAAVILNWKARQ